MNFSNMASFIEVGREGWKTRFSVTFSHAEFFAGKACRSFSAKISSNSTGFGIFLCGEQTSCRKFLYSLRQLVFTNLRMCKKLNTLSSVNIPGVQIKKVNDCFTDERKKQIFKKMLQKKLTLAHACILNSFLVAECNLNWE